MKTITIDEIMRIYNTCGLSGIESHVIRRQINTGSLNNSLKTGFISRYDDKSRASVNDAMQGFDFSTSLPN